MDVNSQKKIRQFNARGTRCVDGLQQLSWTPGSNVANTFLEKMNSLPRTRGEDDEVRDEETFELWRLSESQEQNRAERRVQNAQHSTVGTRDRTTTDQEDQGGAS